LQCGRKEFEEFEEFRSSRSSGVQEFRSSTVPSGESARVFQQEPL
jgi:hypothetical protein